jgi:hypothetical protein
LTPLLETHDELAMKVPEAGVSELEVPGAALRIEDAKDNAAVEFIAYTRYRSLMFDSSDCNNTSVICKLEPDGQEEYGPNTCAPPAAITPVDKHEAQPHTGSGCEGDESADVVGVKSALSLEEQLPAVATARRLLV